MFSSGPIGIFAAESFTIKILAKQAKVYNLDCCLLDKPRNLPTRTNGQLHIPTIVQDLKTRGHSTKPILSHLWRPLKEQVDIISLVTD